MVSEPDPILDPPSVKRPVETSEQNEIPESKRKKRKVNNGRQAIEEKKSVFSRFWSEEDEIAILKGMVEYKLSNRADPYTDMAHERKTFELSKKIWGSGIYVAAASGGIKVSGENFLSMYPRLNESLQWVNHGVSESGRNFLKEGMQLVGSANAENMKEKWRYLQIHEMELYLKRVHLIHQLTKLVLDEIKSVKS
ncbi:probable transcription factor At2g01370 [Cornus florida]|uniref:probable transcription factor At2g01370 n=1 Tax=Cornus florida TaxID=4283 RepID=UPI00289A0655|nr:probable transcription factor At2g01370 [Cornus florida]